MSRIKDLTLADLGRKSVRRNALVSDLLHRIDLVEKDNVVFHSGSVTNKRTGYTTRPASDRNRSGLWEDKARRCDECANKINSHI